MDSLVYDGSFYGLLTAVFEVYEYKIDSPQITRMNPSGSLFGSTREVETNREKSDRVLKLLKQKIDPAAMGRLYKTFLSELPGMEQHILGYIRHVIQYEKPVTGDYSHPDVLAVQQISSKVDRERHRVKAFVRFSLTRDQIYFSLMDPDFNVLPLVSRHFQDRYADQKWLLYDTRRRYGLFYDLSSVQEVKLDFLDPLQAKGMALEMVFDEHELLYQQLWQQYFKSVNIVARKNTRLHLRHMPKRYWKHLVEKK